MIACRPPIIVEGVNHSGTRLIVDILTILGSDPGDVANEWRENAFFLDIHRSLIDRISNDGWTETILNIDFISTYEDTGDQKDYITKRLTQELLTHFPECKSSMWHWKCPTSALFEKTWTSIFPDALYIINRREPAKIAKAFLRRKGIASLSFSDGLKFYTIMEGKIFSEAKRNQLIIDFDNLRDEIDNIADFIGVQITEEHRIRIDAIIDYKNRLWSSRRSLFFNLKNLWATFVYKLYKKGIVYRREVTLMQ